MPTRRERELQLQAQAKARAQAQANQYATGSLYPKFTPYQPPPIPSGYYDPNLDAQRQAASRGLINTEQDIGLAGRRSQEDLVTARGDITQGYERNVEALTRGFKNLGVAQGERANAYGVISGGAVLQAAAKRAANQTREQTYLNQDRDSALAKVGTAYERGVGDRGDALSRARSEDQFFGLDVGAQKLYQAQQAGYAAPTGPSNEGITKATVPYREIRRGGYVIRYDQNGREISRRRA